MDRPRWHDVLIAAAILGLLALGIWALWWNDVRALLGAPPTDDLPVEPVPLAPSQT